MVSHAQSKDAAAAATLARTSPFSEQAKRLSIVDGRRTAAVISLQWLAILATIVIAEHTGADALHWLAVCFAIVIIASRQQALTVLMHEAAHYRLFQHRGLNDTASDLFCALPFGFVTARYRQTHLAHHLDTLGPNDPDWTTMQAHPREWAWPKPRRQIAWTLLRDACGLGFAAFIQQWNDWFPLKNHFGKAAFPAPLSPAVRLRIYLFYGVTAAFILGFGLWREVLLYWVLPLVTVSQVMFRVRTISEHLGCGNGSGAAFTRNVEAGWMERFLISPLNVSHHLTHHLFPGVPWYNLPKLTKQLHDDGRFRAAAYVSSSYLGKNGVVRRELLSET